MHGCLRHIVLTSQASVQIHRNVISCRISSTLIGSLANKTTRVSARHPVPKAQSAWTKVYAHLHERSSWHHCKHSAAKLYLHSPRRRLPLLWAPLNMLVCNQRIEGGQTYTLILLATPCRVVSFSASVAARSKACLLSSLLFFSTSS